ncbi:hypothetical protein H6P81_009681 [Aristolochia fimbriata]|uniref:Uncharacterized protein n=1 Tax=Aristolochia fimbriata TaxID=158543 RepID=A0AAV7EPU3_ARIFI|nr:hypothetical protein H6P81_009681 [Aristolochia fimbriata]
MLGVERTAIMSLISQNASSRKLAKVISTDGADAGPRDKENEKENSLDGSDKFGKEGKEEMQNLTDRESMLFYLDRSADGKVATYQENLESQEDCKHVDHKKEKKPVWVDEEEEKTVVDHIKLNPGTEWAQMGPNLGDYRSDDESSENDDGAIAAPGYTGVEADYDILRSNEDVVVKGGSKLFPGLLDYSTLVDANSQEQSNGPINSVQFHRNGQLLLTGGLDRRLRFFQIDGKAQTKELIATLKMNGTARSLAFADDGRQLLSSGGDGHVYHWDLRTRRCFHKAVDEGCMEGSALCTSQDGKFFAAGSSSGIVNVYNRDDFLGGKRKPMKTIENLLTKFDGVKFNHDAQILAITSSMKKNSLKSPLLVSFLQSLLAYPKCLSPVTFSCRHSLRVTIGLLLAPVDCCLSHVNKATVEPCTISKPRVWNPVEHSKWTSFSTMELGKLSISFQPSATTTVPTIDHQSAPDTKHIGNHHPTLATMNDHELKETNWIRAPVNPRSQR